MWFRATLGVALMLLCFVVEVPVAGAVCVGDCNDSGEVKVDELVTSVRIALELSPLSQCEAIETNSDGQATVNELITAVNNALHGCRTEPTPTPDLGNQAPQVDAGDDVITAIDQPPTLIGSATDDGLPSPPAAVTLTWSKVSGSGSVIFGSPNAATTTATFSEVGSYVLRLTANDSARTGSDEVTVHVDISAANVAPTLDPVTDQTITPGSALSLGLVGHDGNPFDALSYSLVTGPEGARVGTDGVFTFIPLATQLGAHVVTVQVQDQDGLMAETSFDVMVVDGNRPPAFGPVSDDVTALGSPYTKTLTATDPDAGDTLSFSLLSAPPGMTLTGAQLSWTPAAEQFGTHVVTVALSDGHGGETHGEFRIVVPSPAAPTARDDAYEVVAGQTLSVPAAGVLVNDASVDGSAITATQLTQPDKGSVTAFSPDGSFTYMAPPGVPPPPPLDAAPRIQLYNFGVLLGYYPPLVANVDGTGAPEIISWVGDELHVVHGDTGEELFAATSLPPPHDGCAMYGRGYDSFAVGDVDDDGAVEIVMNAQCAADSPSYIYVAGNATRVIALAYDADAPSKFRVKWISEPFSPQVANLPGDGHLYVPFGGQVANAAFTIARLRPTEKPTVLIGKSYAGFGGQFSNCGKVLPGKTDPYCRFVFAVDGETGAQKPPYYATPDDPSAVEVYGEGPWGAPAAAVVADVDNDGELDVLYQGTLWNLDGSVKRQFDGTRTTGLASSDSIVLDLDGDPDMEIVTIDNANYRRPGFLKAWKPDGRLLWTLTIPGTTVVTRLSAGDVDRSGRPTILFAIYDTLWAVDHTGHVKWLSTVPPLLGFIAPVNGPGHDFRIYDLNGDGVVEIIWQVSKQTIVFLRGDNGEIQTSTSYPNQPESGAQSNTSPIIADVAGSGQASMVWYHDVNLNGTTLLQVFDGDTAPWRQVAAQFNQRVYWGSNFNPDGTVPLTYPRHTSDPATNLINQQPPLPYSVDPRLRTEATFTYTAQDGPLASAPATVTIGILPENRPPVITALPPASYPEGLYFNDPFTFQLAATDPDVGDTISWTLTYRGCGPEGRVTISPSGLFSYADNTPNETLCWYEARATDNHGAFNEKPFSIFFTSETRTVPDVIGLDRAAALVAVTAIDLGVGSISEVPNRAPAGQVLQQSPLGGEEVPRGSLVQLVVSLGPGPDDSDDDGDGFTENEGDCDDSSAAFSPGLAEVPDNGVDENCDGSERIVREVVVEPASALRVTGEQVAFSATAVYIDGTSADVSTTANWASAAPAVASINASGVARALDIGSTAIRATFGGAVGHATFDVGDRAAGDQDSPTAELSAPANGGTITGLAQVVGTAADPSFLRYELTLARTGEASSTIISAGTSAVVDGVLGTIDTRLLLNDLYTLRLKVWDSNENQATAEIGVQVAGEQKIGLFTLSFIDLTVDVSGLPIQISRTYDSRDKQRGDFGVGWQLGVDTLRLSTNRVLGTGWQVIKPGLSFGLQPTDDHVVSVTLPNGDVEQFFLSITPTVSPLVPLSTMQASFVPGPGTRGTLEPLDNTNLLIADPQPGEVELLDDTTLGTYNPQTFRYTTAEKRQIVINQVSGVQSVTDRNGNTLTFAADGVTHSSGVGVTFDRDAMGRITRITEPSGAQHLYAYDANGDLRSYTDPLGKITRYTYNLDHGLLDIIDPRGIRGVRNEFDESGRLIATTDAEGRTTRFSYDDGLRREVITNRLGQVRVVEYDESGNVTAQTDPLGQRTEYTYDSRGNEITRTDPLGRVQTNTYDAADNLLTTTDADGNFVTRSYNDRNQLLTSTNAAGPTTRTYDSAGNLMSLTDPEGRVTTHTYNETGQVLTTSEPGGRMTRYTYDADGRRTSLLDAAGTLHSYTNDSNGRRTVESAERSLPGGGTETVATRLDYDARGNPTRFTDALGGEIVFGTDDSGRTTSYTDANGNTTAYVYDVHGNLIQTTFPDGSSEVSVFDAERHRTSLTDRDGHLTAFTYDGLGHLLRTVNPDGTFTERSYDAIGRLATITDERGNTTTHTYAQNQETVTDALGNVTVHRYDALGRVIQTTDARGRVTSFTYDSRSNLTGTTFADGTTYTVTYDPTGTRKVSETDQAGRTTSYGYDDLGRLTRVTDAAGGVTTYTYDEVGNLIRQTDAAGRSTMAVYDARGRLTKRTRPLGQFETFTYDANGNVLSHVDFNGDTITFTYDVNNRLVRKTLPGGTEVVYAYTAAGLRTTAGDATYRYDARGRLTSETKESGDVIAYTYDPSGNRTAMKTDAGTTTYSYDELNRLARVVDASGTTTYAYDPVGNRASETYPNGITASYTYDALNRLTTLSNAGPGGLISSYTYALGPIGNRTQVVEAGSATTARTVDYGYDVLYRLTSETIDEAGTASDRTISYTYDVVGNRLTKNDALAAGGQTTETTYSYDANDRLIQESQLLTVASLPRNTIVPQIALVSVALAPLAGVLFVVPLTRPRRRMGRRARRNHALRGTLVVLLATASVFAPGVAHALTLGSLAPQRRAAQGATASVHTYSYDANGNMLTRSNGSQTDSYDFDFENRLAAADIQIGSATGPVSYTYDADGIRTGKTAGGVTTSYLADKNRSFAQVVVEKTAGAVTTYTYGDDRIAITRPGLGPRFYQRDGQHSTRQLTNAAGAVTDGYTYDAFGALLASTGATPNDFLYNGEQLDGNVGFYYLRARYYAQGLGRFISSDPFQGSIFDPGSLHRYLYVNADPVNRSDPSGLTEFLPGLLMVTGVAVMLLGIVAGFGKFVQALQGSQDFATARREGVKAGFGLFILGAVLAISGVLLSGGLLAGASGGGGSSLAGSGAAGAGTGTGTASTAGTVTQIGAGSGELSQSAYLGGYVSPLALSESLYAAWEGLTFLLVVGASAFTGGNTTAGSSTSELRTSEQGLRDDFPTVSAELDPRRTDVRRQRSALGGLRFLANNAPDPELREAATISARFVTLPPAS